jgi:zinc D-Ala-D-Ala dipeptidase
MNAAGTPMLDRRHLLMVGGAAIVASCAPAARFGQSAATASPAEADAIVMPIDPNATATPDLVDLSQHDPRLLFDIRYATPNNFLGRTLYPVARAMLQRPAADALKRVQTRAEAEGFGLLIHDGYRPWRITLAMWQGTSGEARGYVANPRTGSRHNRGCAIDLTLHRGGVAVEMPSAYDDLSARARRDNMDASAEAIANRAVLERIMVAEGFLPLPSEWWHFDWRDWALFPVMDQPF